MKNRLNSKTRQRGLTLLELFIAMALGLIITMGTVQIFSASKKSSHVQQAIGEQQTAARFALDILSHDIRMAGLVGCNNNISITNNTGALTDFGIGISGREYKDLPAPLLQADSSNPSAKHVKQNTDVIILKYAAPQSFRIKSATNASITLATDKHEIKKHTPLIVSDCESADVFIAGETSGATINIGRSNFSKVYDGNAELSHLNYVAYYIDKSNNNLYRRTLNKYGSQTKALAEGLLEGVHDLQILYGIDTSGTGTDIKYINATPGNPDMDKIVSVRINLVFSSDTTGVSSTNTQNYWINGNKVTLTDNDQKKLYRSFTNTIKLRNTGLGT